MASINFEDYQKNQEGPTEERKSFSVGSLETKDTQYYVEEDNVLFDFIELDFGDQGIGVEVWMSFLGEEFKMKVDMLSKEDFDNLDVGNFLGSHLMENLGCLKCRSEFFGKLCDLKHGDEENEET